MPVVALVFQHAVVNRAREGSTDDPNLLTKIIQDDGDLKWAFPIFTERLSHIYKQIMGDYEDYTIHFSPVAVTVLVQISGTDGVDALLEQVNYDYNEGLNWGDTKLDEETRLLVPVEIPDGIDLIYTPLLAHIETL